MTDIEPLSEDEHIYTTVSVRIITDGETMSLRSGDLLNLVEEIRYEIIERSKKVIEDHPLSSVRVEVI